MSGTLDRVNYDARHAAVYESKIRALIPGYETLHELSAFILKERIPKKGRILVAGSGTGEELLRYVRLSADWSLTGIEPSEAMNQIARARIEDSAVGERITLIESALAPDLQLAGFDAATALLVSHFVPDDGSRLRFLQALSQAVRPGGTILIAELIGEQASDAFRQLMRAWRAQQASSRGNAAHVALDFEKLDTAVFPLSSSRWQQLLDELGLILEFTYWQSFGLQAWCLRRS